jgi:hypothetical protein
MKISIRTRSYLKSGNYKLRSLKAFYTICILFLPWIQAISQIADFSVNAGILIPTGKYASSDMDDPESGRASTGFGFGLEKVKPVNDLGLGAIFGIGIYVNGVSNSARDQILADIRERSGISDPDIIWPKYINIPASVGFCFEQGVNELMSVTMNIGLILNLFKLTDFYVNDEVQEYMLSAGVGGRAGFGIRFMDRYMLNLDYRYLGNHDVTKEGVKDFKIGAITISTGLSF